MPVGHYNLAYLLEQKADHKAALTHFQVAAQKDPSLLAAQQWVARLSTPAGQAGVQYAAASQSPTLLRAASAGAAGIELFTIRPSQRRQP